MAHYINIYGKRLFDIGLYLKTSVDLILQQQHVLMSQQKFTDISLCHREAPNPKLDLPDDNRLSPLTELEDIGQQSKTLGTAIHRKISEQKRVIESGSVASIVEHKRTNLSAIMATRANIPEQVRGAPLVDGLKIQNKNGAVKNRRALGDIGNLVSVPGVQGGKAQPPINRPITLSFRAQLLANAQLERKPINGDNKVPALGPKSQPLAARNPEAQRAVQKKNLVVKQQTKPVEVIETKRNAQSKAACGIVNKPKILDIDESDKDNHVAAVEYVDDMYSFYKEVEKESQPKMYMHIQTEMNEKMRAILIDWLLEVHIKFELNLETLYLTVNIIDRFLYVKAVPKRELQVNDLVYVTDNAYSSRQILVMKKAILGNLEWYLTIPTQYVFLFCFIKASISDPEVLHVQKKNLQASKTKSFSIQVLSFSSHKSIVKSDQFCKKFNLCQEVTALASEFHLGNCEAWRETVTKLKDPETKCLKVVFEYTASDACGYG
ncbi:CYCLIN B1;5 [Arabidopsis thaliana]|uniref:Cyclin-B1-5 n=1 Tax=Arabidopsis thaliana TaxID=3702 RepID=CCB15_ARATH|nr:CYCLIN B1;5 [Arabidopsis thaliana]NP_001320186.1 CYCLIN B1;5 [Arabidopsis thaliana]NP_001320190.1 CYCLIN B1;5 [Arabidopsis thaliana]NP_564446.3 CYCLIN B1;5 [Arabidopsis thaliana]Q39072.3 RecName: Full=Cyclin-B1-5; AltName: Full=Cyc3-At; AltName: Full=G2/mitotic-specific cyclin-B1-5; Short=CycB1;5 [Arabidopsis thaliana]AEE31715.1 CYCLIN B1;5 [Arabidopsis thaliana]ANM57698.1 CYCLIN B1;5 [Arabidopsis thaliana]ANM57702.1 CYCLIN B1;5 [Arabidopsis thaliana]ANM57704.1 CYCLIN B1;5 [Arabidopsis t|eukprot:NP_001319145.1 CYCLIN B1;5 [Arabidopsis thaliana]